MLDVAIEQILKVKPPAKALFFKVGMILACIVSALFALYVIGLLSLALLIVGTVLLFQYYDAEYEYTLVEKNLDVDRIMAKSRRKRLGSYNFSKLEIMAPAGHEKLAEYERTDCKVMNYASGYNPEHEYVAYVKDGELIKLILEPNERMLEAFCKMDSRKVILQSFMIAE